MKNKRRLLSLLLAASLITASLPITAYASQPATSEKNESWAGSIDGEIKLVEEGLILKADPNNLPTQADEKYILFDAALITAGTYKVSLRARNISGTNRLMIGFGGWYSGNTLINTPGAGNGSTLTVVSAAVNGTAASRVQYNLLSNDWTTFESTFTVTASGILGLGIADKGFAAVPGQVEIDSFTLIKVDPATGTEIENVGYSFSKTAINTNNSCPGLVPVTSYYSTKDTGATSLKYIADSSERGAGLYTVSAKVRADKAAKLTASIELASGTVSATTDIGTDWSDIELKLDINETFTADKLTISISDGAVLDFDDIVFTQKAAYIFNDEWQGDNGAALPFVTVDEEYIYLAADPSNMPEDDGAYRYDIATLPAGTYKVSFKLRNDKDASGTNRVMLGLGVENNVESAYSLANTNCTTATVISATSNGVNIANPSMQFTPVSSDWQTFEYNFTSTAQYKLKLILLNKNIAVNIKELSIVNTATNETVDYRFDVSADTVYGGKLGTYINYASYYTTEGSGTDTIVSKTGTTYNPGLYTLTGTVKSPTASALSASIKGINTQIASITDGFTNINLTFDMREAFTADQIAITAPDLHFTNLTFSGKEYTINNDYIATNNAAIVTSKTDEKYTYLAADPDNMPDDDGAYRYDIAVLPAGTYKVSFKLRNDPEATGTNQVMVGLGDINQVTSGYALIRTNCTNATVISATLDGEDITSTWKQTTPVANMWQTFEFNFTSEAQYKLKLIFMDKNIAANIKDLSIVNTETNESIDYRFDVSADTAYGGKLGVYIDLGFDYNTTAGSGVNSFRFKDDTELVPGVYTITGAIRANAVGSFTADSGIDSDSGINKASVSVNTIWKNFTLQLDLRQSIKKSDLIFSTDTDYIEFSNLEIEGVPYTAINDWQGTNGAIIVQINEPNPYYVAHSGGDSSDENAWNVNLVPTSKNRLSTGNYRVSFEIRNDPNNKNAANKFEIKLGTPYSGGYLNFVGQKASSGINTLNVKNITIDGIPTNGSSLLNIGSEWTKYTIEFELNTLVADGGFDANANGFLFIVSGDMAPINYRNFTVENLDKKTTSTGEDFTHDAIELILAFADVYNYPGVDYLLDSRFTTANSGANAITPTSGSESDYMIDAGLTHITGYFRAPNGSAALSALYGDNLPLQTLSGDTSVTLDDSWKHVTFILDSYVDIETTDIVISFTDDIEFKDIEITLVEKYYSAYDIDMGTIITLLLLKKDYAIGEDPTNLLNGVIRKSVARKWDFGDQTLEFHRDNDGNYLRAGNIKDTSIGFTCNSGTIAEPGLYVMSGEFRTANAGETSKIRMIAGGITETISIDNEWTYGEFLFEITKKQELVVKICSDPVAFYTMDFDFRNLRVINTEKIPGGYNLYPEGGFDTEGLYGWTFATAEGFGDLSWKQEENGNGYLSFTNRGINYDETSVNTLISLIPGAIYTVSFDMRATDEDTSLTVRTYANNITITVDDPSNRWGNEFDITHEWKHISGSFTATEAANFIFKIKGGQEAEDIASFDFDNIVISRKQAPTNDNLYPSGNFNDKATALVGWSASGGDATMTWNQDENGNGYMTVSDRILNYIGVRITPIKVTAGKTYKISYSIRATNEGETFDVRAFANGGWLTNSGKHTYTITHNWQHVECLYTPSEDGDLTFEIKGGHTENDNKNFDIDNLIISVES